jgi:hypothetical protein
VEQVADTQQPGQLYWSMVEPFWRSVNIYGEPAQFLQQFAALPINVGHLFAAHWCQSEVCNGGLHQFFSNSTGIVAPEALNGFRAIGLAVWVDVLGKAIQFFGEPYPREQAIRREILAKQPGQKRQEWDPFFVLDNQFYRWLNAEPNRWAKMADWFVECIELEPSK